MSLVDDNSNNGFCFIWTIQNFSHCMRKTGSIKSPSFVMHKLKGAKWCLGLQPKGIYSKGFVGFYLELLSEDTPCVPGVRFVLSIRETNGSYKKKEGKPYSFSNQTFEGCSNFLGYHELFKKGRGAYLENDELTLRCRMWVCNYFLGNPVRCYATTKIRVSTITYMWELKAFVQSNTGYISDYTTKIQPCSIEMLPLKLSIFQGVSYNEDHIYISIQQTNTGKPNFLTCKISLLDSDAKVVHAVQDEHRFDQLKGTQVWTLPFLSKRKLLAQKELFLPFGSLKLRFEFVSPTGVESSQVERLEYGPEVDGQLKSPNQIIYPHSPPRAWTDNLERFYSDGKFSDLIVQTPNREFPVHKAFLCAQSEVFSAMFERNMKENRTGVVEIEDLDDDTLDKLLLFIYTGTVQDLEWGMACKLYYAADKYGIVALRNKCFAFCSDNIDTSKVCEVLVLADMHHDNVLKRTAQDFIVKQVDEVINSDDWKKLMRDNSYLTSETMHLMISRNFKCGLNLRNQFD